MIHMAIACNMLAAIGGRPQIATLHHGFPSQGLPGGVEPDLRARLARLSPAQLEVFMRIEVPDFLLSPEHQDESYPTIGDLYDAIGLAIDENADDVRQAMRETAANPDRANQVGDNIGFTTIVYQEGTDPVPLLRAGISEILEQGEGSRSRTLHTGPTSQNEESHYCKFAELHYGRAFQSPESDIALTRETESQFFEGYPIPFPGTVNTMAVPADGYAALLAHDANADAARRALDTFDTRYSQMMKSLDAVWNGPAAKSWPTLGEAVGLMTGLRVPACFGVMVAQIPADAIARLPELYPDEYADIAALTDLDQPVFYGPRFLNLNV
jgi:hypothetical protein